MKVDCVLVGPELEENLSIRYLGGALEAAGFTVSIEPYNQISDAEALADRIIDEGPVLVGISMAFQARGIEDIYFCNLLRERGFKGHLTAGGQFVTLHYQEVFEDCFALDSVVLFEGEKVIVLLAEALKNDLPLESVPSLARRSADGHTVNPSTPEPDSIDSLSWPLRKSPRRHLGFPSAHMVGSRGCHASCSYCCVSALASSRREAAREAGGSTLAGTRRRSPLSVAAEMASLYHNRGVRIFEFQDDNWIPPVPRAAIEYFEELKQELDALAVGRFGFTVKLRADAVTDEILPMLKELGLIRVFVGIESGTQNLLSKLGRKMTETASSRALQTLREHRIPAYFNVLLFGPDLSFDEIEPEFEFLAHHADFPFEIVEVVIYGRTELYNRLESEGRLTGNYLAYDYTYSDSRLARTHSIAQSIETRHFGVYSPAKMAADLGFNLGILRVFHPGPATEAIAGDVEEITRRIGMDQIEVLRGAMQMAEQEIPLDVAREMASRDAAVTDLRFYRELLILQSRMEAYVSSRNDSPSGSVHSYFRGGLVASGMIAGLFSLVPVDAQSEDPPAPKPGPEETGDKSGEAQEAAKTFSDDQLLTMLVSKDESERKQATQALIQSGKPIQPLVAKSMIGRRADDPDTAKLMTELRIILKARRDADLKKLREVVTEAAPKLKIGGGLLLEVDPDGKVKRISTLFGPLQKDIEDKLIKQLAKREFKSLEIRESTVAFPGGEQPASVYEKQTVDELLKHFRLRLGPLD